MDNKELISIIVPIYNVEKYLEKCVNSIRNQTYRNLEILLIDDGSTDNSKKMCDSFAKDDERIKVIHKKNGGLSSARNCGIDSSLGKYLMFIDSDDYIAETMVEKLYNFMKENNTDISICNLCHVYSDGKKMGINFPKENLVINDKTKYYNIYNKYSVATVVAWNKLYKSSIFKNIRYPEGKIHEDEWVIMDVLDRAKSIGYYNEVLYYYFQRSNSISNHFNLKNLNITEVHENRLKRLQENRNLLKWEYVSYILCLARKIIPGLKELNEKEKEQEYRKRLKELIMELTRSYKLNLKEKIHINFIKISPRIYLYMYKSYCYLKDTINRERMEAK